MDMTNFRTALIALKPLYIDGTMRVNFTVDELVNFVEDYMKDNQPIMTVEVHEARTNKATIEVSAPVKHTQDNHLKTRL